VLLPRLFACSLALCFVVVPVARAQEVSAAPTHACRDAWGEPRPCEIVVTAQLPAATLVAPGVAPTLVPPPAPAPTTEPRAATTVYERDGGYSQLGPVGANVDPPRLHFTPQDPDRVPALARGLRLSGDDVPLGLTLAGFSLSWGARTAGFLRFPELRVSMVGGDTEPGRGPTASQGELTATITSLLVMRADLGLGFEAHLGMFGFYATARAGIAGYFADAALTHATLGDLGRIQLAEDALELGWELAVSVEIEEGLSLQLAAEGMHLGAETLGASARVVGTF